MKKKWMQSLNLADERYIDEANPYRVVKRSRRTVAVIAAVVFLPLYIISALVKDHS